MGKRDIMRLSIRTFISNEDGLETVEYAVMTSLVLAAMIVSFVALGVAIRGRFNTTASTIATN